MPRKRRIDFPGAWQHVMNRGARKNPIFTAEEHILLFMQILEETVRRFSLELHSFALMLNHYHLLFRVPLGNLSKAMQFLSGRYVQRLNRKNGWDGPVFKGRYSNQVVLDRAHLRILFAYIHLNPVKAGLVKRPEDASWSSHATHLGLSSRHTFIERSGVKLLFSTPESMEKYIEDFRYGRDHWPESFDPVRGIFHYGKEQLSTTLQTEQACIETTIEKACEWVSSMTGESPTNIKRSSRGLGASDGRRILVWLLGKRCGISHREIGRFLGITPDAVAGILQAIRYAPRESPVINWIQAADDLELDSRLKHISHLAGSELIK